MLGCWLLLLWHVVSATEECVHASALVLGTERRRHGLQLSSVELRHAALVPRDPDGEDSAQARADFGLPSTLHGAGPLLCNLNRAVKIGPEDARLWLGMLNGTTTRGSLVLRATEGRPALRGLIARLAEGGLDTDAQLMYARRSV